MLPYIAGSCDRLGAKHSYNMTLEPFNEKDMAFSLKQQVKEIHAVYYGTLYITEFNVWYWEGGLFKLPIDLTPSIKIKKVVTGHKHFCILLDNGNLYCFRCNEDKQLGLEITLGTEYGELDLKEKLNKPFVYFNVSDVHALYYGTIFMVNNIVYAMGRSSQYQFGINVDKVPSYILELPKELSLVGNTILKYITSSHTIMLLSSDGIIYATGTNLNILTAPYEGFKALEPFYSNGWKIRNAWSSATGTFIQLVTGEVYYGGHNTDHACFGVSNANETISFSLCKFLSHKVIYDIIGLYSLIAICEDGVYVCGNSYCRQLDNDNVGCVKEPIKHELLTKLVKQGAKLTSSFRVMTVYFPVDKTKIFKRKLYNNQGYNDLNIHCLT